MEQELQRQFWSGLTFSFPYMSWKPQKNRSPHRLPRPQHSPPAGHTVFNYPTLAEAYKVAALDGLNKL
jgi:hypothetical protein